MQNCKIFSEMAQATVLVAVICLTLILHEVGATLIASSEIKYCTRSSSSFEPVLRNGKPCEKQFLVTLAVRSGQGQPQVVMANMDSVTNSTGPIKRREQLKRPFRILVKKTSVIANYPLRHILTINSQPREWSWNVKNKILGIARCNLRKHCKLEKIYGAFCCKSSSKEKRSKRWEYKRGHGKKEGHYFSHKYSQAVCMDYDPLWYYVFTIEEPEVMYGIHIHVQQRDYVYNTTTKREEVKWKNIGEAVVGPKVFGRKVTNTKVKNSPEVIAAWQGDFAGSSRLPNLNSKVLMSPMYFDKPKVVDPLYKIGASKYLLAPRHMVDETGSICRMIGARTAAFIAQESRCYRLKNSCFDTWTPKWIYHYSRMMYERKGRKSPFFPLRYGKVRGLFQQQDDKKKDTKMNRKKNKKDKDKIYYLSYDVSNTVSPQSLVTLSFVADSVSFVENRSPGRIVETVMEDITELNGGGVLTVIVQNTGSITADYAVSVDECTEGIVRVAQQTQSLDPRQQGTFEWEISAGINTDLDHNCTVILYDQDGSILDTKPIHFKTLDNCIYCSDGQCNCSCNAEPENNSDCRSEYLDHFYKPRIVTVHPCYHCWFTDSFRDPYTCTFSVVLLLMILGMTKMLCMFCCCRTNDGRYVDVSAILLGTANQEHTRIKQRSVTLQFLLGVCFFVYLPLLPCIIVFCSWRRRSKARARLRKKAARKQERLKAKKQAALLAMKGMMVQEKATLEDALKKMEEGQMPGGQAPTLPPRVIVVSSSSGTDNQDFNYTSSSEDMLQELGLTDKQVTKDKGRGTNTWDRGITNAGDKVKGRGKGRGRAKEDRVFTQLQELGLTDKQVTKDKGRGTNTWDRGITNAGDKVKGRGKGRGRAKEDMLQELGLTDKQVTKDKGRGMNTWDRGITNAGDKVKGRGKGRGRAKDVARTPGEPRHMKKKGGEKKQRDKKGQMDVLAPVERKRNKREERFDEFDRMMKQSHGAPAVRPKTNQRALRPGKPRKATTGIMSFLTGGSGKKKRGGTNKKGGSAKKKGGGSKKGRDGKSCTSGGKSKVGSLSGSGSEDRGGSKHGSDDSNDQAKSEGDHCSGNEEQSAKNGGTESAESHGSQGEQSSHSKDSSHGEESSHSKDSSHGEGSCHGGDNSHDKDNSRGGSSHGEESSHGEGSGHDKDSEGSNHSVVSSHGKDDGVAGGGHSENSEAGSHDKESGESSHNEENEESSHDEESSHSEESSHNEEIAHDEESSHSEESEESSHEESSHDEENGHDEESEESSHEESSHDEESGHEESSHNEESSHSEESEASSHDEESEESSHEESSHDEESSHEEDSHDEESEDEDSHDEESEDEDSHDEESEDDYDDHSSSAH